MYLSIDFGGSTVDVAWWKEDLRSLFTVFKIESFERSDFSFERGLSSFIKFTKLSLVGVEKIFVTGGKSYFFSSKLKNIPVIKVPEIEAIGKGGRHLIYSDNKLKFLRSAEKILVVSMGTGTCIVELQQKNGVYFKSTHVGGTGVGGGTFLGLCNALLSETDIRKLKKLFQRGNHNKVDLSVEDIIGSGIGKVPASATASNLAKLAGSGSLKEINFSDADMASGIVHLVGQTIGVVTAFAAMAQNVSAVLLTGKLTRIDRVLDIIIETTKMYNVRTFIPKNGSYVSVLGAGVRS